MINGAFTLTFLPHSLMPVGTIGSKGFHDDWTLTLQQINFEVIKVQALKNLMFLVLFKIFFIKNFNLSASTFSVC